MSTEHREMRPFASVAVLDGLVAGARLHAGDLVVESGTTRALETDVYLRVGVQLILPGTTDRLQQTLADLSADATMEQLGLSLDDLEVVVIATSPFLKIVDMVARFPIRELAELGPAIDVSGDPRRDALLSPNSGCEVVLMVCLATPKPKAPLRPWRRGTWLARATFGLTTEHALTGFTPQPMDAAKKEELGVPSTTARYITMASTSPLDENASEEDVEMWVDADLLAQMSAMPRSKGSLALQRQLFIDAVAAIVTAAHRNDLESDVPTLATCSWPDVERSLLGRVIIAMAPTGSNDAERDEFRSQYLNLIRTDPARFMAWAEDLAGVSKSFNELMED